jgi:hypothetical protein
VNEEGHQLVSTAEGKETTRKAGKGKRERKERRREK